MNSRRASDLTGAVIAKSGRPVMHTFYEPVPGGCCGASAEAHLDLLQRWEEAWQRAGWDTKVLTVADAEKNPDLAEFKATIKSRIMDINEYNLYCFYRWFAMAGMSIGRYHLHICDVLFL